MSRRLEDHSSWRRQIWNYDDQLSKKCNRTFKPTYPLVISTPKHVGKKIKYMIRKFGFLYQDVLSCMAISDTKTSADGFLKREPAFSLETISCRYYLPVNGPFNSRRIIGSSEEYREEKRITAPVNTLPESFIRVPNGAKNFENAMWGYHQIHFILPRIPRKIDWTVIESIET